MERRQFGKTDMQVTALGFGGSELGYGRADTEAVAKVLNDALDSGLNVIDTAECYGTGEETVGQAVSHRRKDYFLFTKCGHSSGLDLPDWNPDMLRQSIDRSLKRLQTDYVDLLQLHSCSEEILRQGDVIEVLREAQLAGKTRYIGYSGDRENAVYAIQSGAFDSLQTSLNIFDQQAVDLTLPLAREKGMGVIIKRPIGNAVWRYADTPENGYIVPYWERMKVLNYDFLNGDPAQSASVALRFTLGLPGVHTAIVGTTRPERWRENASYLSQGWLSESEYNAIRTHWQKISHTDWVGQT